MDAIDEAAIKVQIEIAVVGGHLDDLLAFDEALGAAAIGDEVLDGADAKAMAFLELHQFRKAHAGTVRTEDFANDTGGLHSSQAGEIDARFGVASAAENATGFCAERENVAGLNQIGRLGVGIDEDFDGAGAV